MNRFDLSGKRALVTGGSKGLGAAMAQALAEAGADLVLVARGEETLAETAADIRKTGRQVDLAPFDMLQSERIEEFYSDVVKTSGPIDILINNAGMTRRGSAEELTLADWQTVLDLNLTSVFALSSSFARERIGAGHPGKIVNVGSLMSSTTRPNNAPYAASKGGILLLTKALAVDWAEHGILVNAIGPGYFDTPMNSPLVNDPDFTQWVTGRCPMGRWGKPDDLAGAVVFLASAASDFVTGQILYVDGGWLARF